MKATVVIVVVFNIIVVIIVVMISVVIAIVYGPSYMQRPLLHHEPSTNTPYFLQCVTLGVLVCGLGFGV